jgi:hypothetical protein
MPFGDVLLISGVPASGKTHFGAWLERTKGFIHIDYEKEMPRLKREGLWPTWAGFLSSRNAKPFVEALRALGSPVVWDWGFPPEAIAAVGTLKREGFQIW